MRGSNSVIPAAAILPTILFNYSVWRSGYVMPENNGTNNTTTPVAQTVTAADVDWIDHYGPARIHGHRFTPGDIAEFEYRHDRDQTGRLTERAKTRIAKNLTIELDTRAKLWRKAREAYEAERRAESGSATSEFRTFHGPADTGISTPDTSRPPGVDTKHG